MEQGIVRRTLTFIELCSSPDGESGF